MPRELPFRRPEPDFAKIYVGAAPSASEWHQYAQLANWIYGKGTCLVPACCPEDTIPAGSTYTYRFYAEPRVQAKQRVWNVGLRALAGPGVTAEVNANSVGLITYPVSLMPNSAPIKYVETITSPSGTAQELVLTIKAIGQNIFVEKIECYEQDRFQLTTAASEPLTTTGPQLESVLIRQPITTLQGFGEITAIANNGVDARRAGIFAWAVDTSAAITRTTASYTSIFTLAQAVQAHKDLIADTTHSVNWRVYAKVTAGTGLVRLTTSGSAVSDVHSITGTSFAWSAARAVSIYCDDMSVADGRKASTWDDATFEYQGPGGADTLSVAAIAIYTSS